MTDRDALYRSICTNPDDDTPRLVYADWLEENGHAEEAEFIRVECRLEATAPDDPDYTGLLDRREELRLWLTAHVPGPILKFPLGLAVLSGPEWWNWTQRGFSRFVEFDGYGRSGSRRMRVLAQALEKAFAKLPTRWLVVRFLTVEQLAELLKQPAIAALDQLTIQFDATDNPQDEACRLIAECPHLRNLRGMSLAFPIGDVGAAALARSEALSALNWLTLNQCMAWTPTGVRTLGSAPWFRNLQSLHLSELLDESFGELCRLDPFPRLHTLELEEASFAHAAWQTFARSKTFPGLTRLVNHTDMADRQAAALAGANGLRPAVLDLGVCAIGNDGAEALARAPWLESLSRLDLAFNRLGAPGFTAIAGSRRLAGLKHLNLSYNTPWSRGLRVLAANPALRGLTTLLLKGRENHNRGLTPAHFHEFLTQLDMPNLRHLNLSGRPVGAKAARLLMRTKFASLTRLGLDQCRLSDSATASLVNAPSLQGLIEFDAAENGLRTGMKPLADRTIMPRLAAANFSANRISRELVHKLKRRPGITV